MVIGCLQLSYVSVICRVVNPRRTSQKIWRGFGEIVHYLPDEKTKLGMALQLSLLRESRPKSARASPRQCTQSAPDFILIGSLSAAL